MNKQTFLDAITPLIDRPWVAPTVDLLGQEMGGSGSHGFGHLLRVLRNAARIRQGEVERGVDVDWEILAGAALLHDVVDLPKDHPERHLASTKSADAAREHFEAIGAFASSGPDSSGPDSSGPDSSGPDSSGPDSSGLDSSGLLDKLHHAVRAHSFSAGVPAESAEAQILCDADRLESLGAFGVARVFYVSGELNRQICEMHDPFAQHRELDDLEYAVDHFHTKLLKLKERFYTPTGRSLAADRHAFMERFLEQLGDEIA